MRLTDRTTAVIVGGAGGVGRGTALGLIERGVRVVIADIEVDHAEEVATELRGRGGEALAVGVDATDEDSLVALADAAEERFGSIDVVANNVGVIVDSALVESTEQQWGWAFEFNVMSIVRSCRHLVPRIRAHGRGGHVVNTASMAALFAGRPDQVGGVHLGVYTATKHAVLGYSESLRGELEADGIGVSCMCPGMVDSNLMATSLRNRPRRYGGPEEAGDTAGLIPGAMDQEDLGPYVVAAIEDNRLHVLTHPSARPLVDARYERLRADFEFFTALEQDDDG